MLRQLSLLLSFLLTISCSLFVPALGETDRRWPTVLSSSQC